MPGLTPEDVRRIPHLSSLLPEEAARLAPELVVRNYAVRDLIAVEGEPCRGFFQLLEGRARLFRTGPEGREQILRLLHPGDTFGEVPVFDDGGNPATVEALEDCRVLLVPAATFRRVIESHPRVALDLLAHFARRLRSFTELVEQISLQTVQQRVARYLYTTAREEGVRSPEGILIQRTITQQDLAALVGSVREVVSRTMRVLEEDGLVEIRRKEILIRDLPGLGRLL
jgi:CRP-like cAMP-binding protein